MHFTLAKKKEIIDATIDKAATYKPTSEESIKEYEQLSGIFLKALYFARTQKSKELKIKANKPYQKFLYGDYTLSFIGPDYDRYNIDFNVKPSLYIKNARLEPQEYARLS